jgi:hypothetical protein
MDLWPTPKNDSYVLPKTIRMKLNANLKHGMNQEKWNAFSHQVGGFVKIKGKTFKIPSCILILGVENFKECLIFWNEIQRLGYV